MVTTKALPDPSAPADHARAGDHVQRKPLTVGLWLVIILKTCTALLLWATFVLLLFVRRHDPQDFFSQLLHYLSRGNAPAVAIRYIADNTAFVTRTMITRVAAATVAYALVESTEAVGLVLRKAWAEWLVIVVTVSFVPLELFELLRRPLPFKLLTLLANILVLIYLLKRLLDKRAEEPRRAILRDV